jgi:hypothetical protein
MDSNARSKEREIRYDPGMSVAQRAKGSSNTDLNHGSKDSWKGDICYDDNHVNFEATNAPPSVVWRDATGKPFAEVRFHAGRKDSKKTDEFLGIRTKHGAPPAECEPICDGVDFATSSGEDRPRHVGAGGDGMNMIITAHSLMAGS